MMLMVDPAESEQALHTWQTCVGAEATVVRSSARLVELHARQADKGSALAKLSARLGIAREQVMAIGDQDNDEPMLAWAGLGVAMGNASPRARTAADWVAPPIDEDGAAVAIEQFALSPV